MDDFFGRGYIILDEQFEPVEFYFGSREGAEKRADTLGRVLENDEVYSVSEHSYPIYREMFKDKK